MEEFSCKLKRLGIRFSEGVSGGLLTTFKSGGAAKYLAFPADAGELSEVLASAREEGIAWRVLGGGSNVLLPDEGFGGVLIRLSQMSRILRSGRRLTVGAGVKMPLLARFAAECGLSGAEFACGIPGTVGGAAAVNAGAFGQSISDLLVDATALTEDGKAVRLTPLDLAYGYHRAHLPERAILLSVTLALTESDGTSIFRRMKEMREKRARTQPKEPSAGSVFRRVEEIPAALYVEQTGLKGMRIGGAELSPVHCNFIVNKGGASTADFFALAEKVKESVRAQSGVSLEYEVERIC